MIYIKLKDKVAFKKQLPLLALFIQWVLCIAELCWIKTNVFSLLKNLQSKDRMEIQE